MNIINISDFDVPATNPVRETYPLLDETPDPPKGFEFTGEFRVPEVGEWFLNYLNTNMATHAYQKDKDAGLLKTRLILKFIPKPTKKKVYKFKATGEVRVPEVGEWFINAGANWKDFQLVTVPDTYACSYPIYTLKESEEL